MLTAHCLLVSSDPKDKNPFLNQVMSVSTSSLSVATQGIIPESGVEQIELLNADDDLHGGVVVDMKDKPMDSEVFASLLKASLSHWKQKVFWFLISLLLCFIS